MYVTLHFITGMALGIEWVEEPPFNYFVVDLLIVRIMFAWERDEHNQN